MTWKNWEMIAETPSYIFRRRSRCRRRRVCLSFLVSSMRTSCEDNYSNLDPFRLLETHESTRVNSQFVQSFTMAKCARHPPGITYWYSRSCSRFEILIHGKVRCYLEIKQHWITFIPWRYRHIWRNAGLSGDSMSSKKSCRSMLCISLQGRHFKTKKISMWWK